MNATDMKAELRAKLELPTNVQPSTHNNNQPAKQHATNAGSSRPRAAQEAQRDPGPNNARRKWTEEDYRLRGLRTPEERASEPTKRLNVKISSAGYEAIRRHALAERLSLGEALDALLAR
jgi:hypothetical protein